MGLMRTYLFEVTNMVNWGKFMVGIMDSEWLWRSKVSGSPMPILAERGWDHTHIWVMDLETGEGACFRHGGYAAADLNKHKVWVCVLFEPFLTWLYLQDLERLEELSGEVVHLPEAPAAMHGYRHPGADDDAALRQPAMFDSLSMRDIIDALFDHAQRPVAPRPPELHLTAGQLRAELSAMDPARLDGLVAVAEQVHDQILAVRDMDDNITELVEEAHQEVLAERGTVGDE
jgi:hypothetical protein